MNQMEESDFADMVEHTPVTSTVIEYREPDTGKLVAACLTDVQHDGLSMVYSFYDPDHTERSGLGTFVILDHMRLAAAQGLDYVYLGYWVAGSDRMQYKVRFRPLERLTRTGWERIDGEEQDRLIAAAVAAPAIAPRPARPRKDALPESLHELHEPAE